MTHARNYHNMYWDLKDPDAPPRFREMASASGRDGALFHDWLNWDREYSTWRRAGLSVQASGARSKWLIRPKPQASGTLSKWRTKAYAHHRLAWQRQWTL